MISRRNLIIFVVLVIVATYLAHPGNREMLELFVESGQMDKAYELAPAAVEKGQENFHLLVAASEVYERKGEGELAVETLEQALELRPQSVMVLEKIALYLTWNQRQRESLPYIERILEIKPERYDLMLTLANAYRYYGMETEESKTLARFLLAAPEPHKALAAAWRGKPQTPSPDPIQSAPKRPLMKTQESVEQTSADAQKAQSVTYSDMVVPVLRGLAERRIEQGPEPLRDNVMRGIFSLLASFQEKLEKGGKPDVFEYSTYALEQFVLMGFFEEAEQLAREWDSLLEADDTYKKRYAKLLVWSGLPGRGARYLYALAEERGHDRAYYKQAYDASIEAQDFELAEKCLDRMTPSGDAKEHLRELAKLHDSMGRPDKAAQWFIELVSSGNATAGDITRMLQLSTWSENATLIRHAAELTSQQGGVTPGNRELLVEAWLSLNDLEKAYAELEALYEATRDARYLRRMLHVASNADGSDLTEKALARLFQASGDSTVAAAESVTEKEIDRMLQLSMWSENATLIRQSASLIDAKGELPAATREMAAEAWLSLGEPERAYTHLESLYEDTGEVQYARRMLEIADSSDSLPLTEKALGRTLTGSGKELAESAQEAKTREIDYEWVLQLALWSENATLIRRSAEILERQSNMQTSARELTAEAWLAIEEPARAYAQLELLYEDTGDARYVRRMLQAAGYTNDPKFNQKALKLGLATFPDDVDIRRSAAEGYLAGEQKEQALSLLQSVAQDTGSAQDLLAYLQAAAYAGDAKALQKAAQFAEAFLKDKKADAELVREVRTRIAEAYSWIGGEKARADQLVKLAADHPYDFKITLAAAEAAEAAQMNELAISLYERASKLSPNSARVLIILAERYLWAGREADAAATYSALEQLGEAPLEGRLVLGRAAYEKGDWEGTQRHLEPLYTEGKLERDDAFMLAMAMDKTGRAVNAEAIYMRLAEENAQDAAFLTEIASEAYYSGALPRAASLFRMALHASPDNPVALKGVALSAGSGDRQSARDSFVRYLQTRPDDPEARYMLAELYEESGMAEDAAQQYRAALDTLRAESSSGTAAGRRTIPFAFAPKDSRLMQARVLERTGHNDEAFAVYASLMAERPDDLQIVEAYADTLMRRKRYDEVRPILSHWIERRPESATALKYLGELAVAENNPKAAVGYYERALRLSKSPGGVDIAALEGLAYALWSAGRETDALERFNELSRLKPQDKAVFNAIRDICRARRTEYVSHWTPQSTRDLCPSVSFWKLGFRSDEPTPSAREAETVPAAAGDVTSIQ